jgi:general stress protein CsbA
MNFVRFLPVILSLLILAAHFYRAGNLILVVLMAVSPLLLFIRSSWIVRIIQVELIIGGIEWIRTILRLVNIRQAHNLPWERLAVILGSVAAFTILSALVFNFNGLRSRFKTDHHDN